MAESQAVAALTDDQINTADPDAPEVTDWSDALRGCFYLPIKKQREVSGRSSLARIAQARIGVLSA